MIYSYMVVMIMQGCTSRCSNNVIWWLNKKDNYLKMLQTYLSLMKSFNKQCLDIKYIYL